LQGRIPNTSAGNWFQCWIFLFTKNILSISVLCLLLLIFLSLSSLLRQCSRFNLSPIGFHAPSPQYALKRAHMRDNFLRKAKVSHFALFVLCANLAAFYCIRSNAIICPPVRIPARCHIFKNRAYK